MDPRLDLFRMHFERLDPAAGPGHAAAEDYYAAPPGRSVGEQLASRLTLAPTSSHILVGGVGAGKSTQLYRAAQALRATADTRAVYIDVSRRHDLKEDLGGVLLVLAGQELARHVRVKTDAVTTARQQFRKWAEGYREFVPYEPDDDQEDDPDSEDPEPGHWRRKPGVIASPLKPLQKETSEKIEALATLKAALPKQIRHFIVLFDSLDRLDDVDAFRNAAVEDARALKQAGVGVAIVGPMRLLYGHNRGVTDTFDTLHVVPAVDVTRDPAANDFFLRVLDKRADDSFLPREVQLALVRASGGLLRDLLHLTRDAVEEAFLADANVVTLDHVTSAVDAFGRTMMFGLRKREISTLQHLRQRRTYIPTDDEDMALLVTRRVIEYQRPSRRYVIHPALDPLLLALEGKK